MSHPKEKAADELPGKTVAAGSSGNSGALKHRVNAGEIYKERRERCFEVITRRGSEDKESVTGLNVQPKKREGRGRKGNNVCIYASRKKGGSGQKGSRKITIVSSKGKEKRSRFLERRTVCSGREPAPLTGEVSAKVFKGAEPMDAHDQESPANRRAPKKTTVPILLTKKSRRPTAKGGRASTERHGVKLKAQLPAGKAKRRI